MGTMIAAAVLAAGVAGQVTVGSWNSKHLGFDDNRDWAAVAQVVAPYDLIAVQGVKDSETVMKLAASAGAASGAQWASSSSAPTAGTVPELAAFLWRADRIEPTGWTGTYPDPKTVYSRAPFAVAFKTHSRARQIVAVTYRGDTDALRARREVSELPAVLRWVASQGFDRRDIVIAASFNVPSTDPAFAELLRTHRAAVTQGGTILGYEAWPTSQADNVLFAADRLAPVAATVDRYPHRLKIGEVQGRERVSDHHPVKLTFDTRRGIDRVRDELGIPEGFAAASLEAESVEIVCVEPIGASKERPLGAVRLANVSSHPVLVAGWMLLDDDGNKQMLRGVLPEESEAIAPATESQLWDVDGATAHLLDHSGRTVAQLTYAADGENTCE